MAVKNDKFTILTKGFDDVVEITSKIQDIVSFSNIDEGVANIFVASSTASILTLEYEPGLVLDLPKVLEMLVPINKIYKHDNMWQDGNAFSHLKTCLIGNNVTLPIIDGKIKLGNYQQIILIDFDNKPSNKEIIVSVVY